MQTTTQFCDERVKGFETTAQTQERLRDAALMSDRPDDAYVHHKKAVAARTAASDWIFLGARAGYLANKAKEVA